MTTQLKLNITEKDIFSALRFFLSSILPSGIDVFKAEINRVSEPETDDFVVMSRTLNERISTNINSYEDDYFIGSINGTVLTIESVGNGTISLNDFVVGNGVLSGTIITGFLTGAGGIGTYSINNPQIVNSIIVQTGINNILEPTKITIQLDIHGPDSANNAQKITTLLLSEYAYNKFKEYGFDIVPLYAGEPKQMPFMNAEQQYEIRWIVEVILQANNIIGISQQYAYQLEVGLIDVP